MELIGRVKAAFNRLIDRVIESRDLVSPPVPRTDRKVDQAARYLVQKLARYTAAVHAVQVSDAARRAGRPFDYVHHVTLERRVRVAREIVLTATVELRLALGLPEHPSAIEVNGWGEAP